MIEKLLVVCEGGGFIQRRNADSLNNTSEVCVPADLMYE